MNSQGEFVVETKEHCFICLINISTVNKEESIYSIQSLSRYLKLDIGKVFNDKGTVPLHLLDQVQRSKLKVKLCENCVCLIETFSKLYQQLEKIEMEVGCCIKLIHEKLTSAENTDHLQNVASGCQSINEWTGKLEIANVLRNEAMEKCSFRLNSIAPQVKIQNLTSAQANAKIKKFRPCKTRKNVSKTSYKSVGNSETKMSYVKLENDELDMMSEDAIDVNYRSGSDSTDEDLASSPRVSSVWFELKNEETESSVDNAGPDGSETEFKLSNPASQPPKATFNPENGKYKCSRCAQEFCRNNYANHHIQSVHMGVVRFNCKICSRDFCRKDMLPGKRHLRVTTCGKGQPPKPIKIACKCKLCGKGFAQQRNLKRHYDAIHRKIRRFACNFCEKKFTRKHHMERHQRVVHFGIKFKRKAGFSESKKPLGKKTVKSGGNHYGKKSRGSFL